MSEMGIRRVGTIVEGSRHPESTNHEDNIMRRTMKQCLRKIRAEHVVISLPSSVGDVGIPDSSAPICVCTSSDLVG